MRRVVFLCFDFICNFFLLSPFRDQKKLERKTFFFFARFLVYFVQLSLYRWGRGRARGWRDAAYPTKKGRQGRLSLGSGAFRRSAGRLQGVSRNPPAAAAPNKTPPAKETHQRPRFRGKRGSRPKTSTGSTPNNHRVQIICLFYKKTGGGTRKENEKKFPRFPPFPPLSLSQQPLSSPLSRSKLFPLSLSLCFSLFLAPSLSRAKKNAGVVL